MAKERKMLIVSDSHGERQILFDLLVIYEEEVDTFLHLGDSEFDDLDKIWQSMIPIKGNNDYGEGYINKTVVTLGQARIFACHGHKQNVYESRHQVAREAKKKDCHFACYGHTHVPLVEEIEGVIIFNPGSLAQPRGPIKKKLYIILSLDGEDYRIDYYNDQHRLQEEMTVQGSLR